MHNHLALTIEIGCPVAAVAPYVCQMRWHAPRKSRLIQSSSRSPRL